MSALEQASPFEKFSYLSPEEREARFERQARKHGLPTSVLKAQLRKSWRFIGRPKQLEPAGDWTFWWVKAGRGFGKTLTGAQWTKKKGLARRCRIALVAPTLRDVRFTMVEGETGLLSILPNEALMGQSREFAWNKSTLELTLANGTILQGFSSEVPDRLRGPQHDYAWGEEVSSWNDANSHDPTNTTWSNLKFGLRLGPRPQAVLTSTPKANRLTRELDDLAKAGTSVVLVRGSSYENRANLSEVWWRDVIAPLEGTRTGRQEIEAETLDDVEGALWTLRAIDLLRLPPPPPVMKRIVVGVDPNTTSGEAADDAGIIVCGEGYARDEHGNRHAYVLADRTTTRGGPAAWAQAAVRAYHDFEADRIVAEKNQGGEMVGLTIKGVDPTVPVKLVQASRGKRTRAEPVASLYEPVLDRDEETIIRPGLIHHVGAFPDLEDEMTTWTGEGESPNRMDALVWGMWDLKLWTPATTHRGGIPRGQLPGTTLGAGLGDLATGTY